MYDVVVRVLIVCSLLGVASFTAVASPARRKPAGAAAAAKTVGIEDFEHYANDQELAKIWYRPPHGGGAVQTLDVKEHASGKYGLRFAYSTSKEDGKQYAAICRVSKWDLSGTNAARFWLKPDGSGRKLMFQFNIANEQGKNIHDLWDFEYFPKKGDSAPRLVTVPYAALVHDVKYADSPNTSPVFRPEAVIEVALYIGSRKDEPGDGVYYFDDFAGVQVR